MKTDRNFKGSILRSDLIFGISLFFLTIAGLNHVAAQKNLNFEKGIAGWIPIGNAKYISTDKKEAKNGNYCARIGEGFSGLMQKIIVLPFSIVFYNGYLKSSSPTIKGYSFIRFYDIHNKLLLEYKSKPVTSITYEKSGNYTEAPPFTSYLGFGVVKDSSDGGFIYADDFEIQTKVGEPVTRHKTQCNIEEYMRPFWKSDTIFNETLLLYSVNGQPASGTLLFEPEKIVSVESYNLKRSFTNGRDYVSNGNIIVRTSNSGMPFRTDTSFDWKNNLAWYDVQSQWVVVNYIHKDKWQGPVPEYKGDRMPGTMHKLLSKQPLKIAAYGMSITRGMDVSGYDTIAPYMPTYLDLFATQLRKIYSNNRIKLYNAGLPGSTVSWGEKYVDDYINPLKPDLVILDFGMNDFWSTTPDQFEKSILAIINKIKIKNPQTEFILLSNLKYDPDYILGSDKNKIIYDANMDGYNIRLKGLEAKGIVNLDMTTLSEFIYSHKKAKDCIANPMHPNDYMARWYAQGLVQLLSY